MKHKIEQLRIMAENEQISLELMALILIHNQLMSLSKLFLFILEEIVRKKK